MTPIIAKSQAGLNITHGPVFSVDLFNVEGDDQTVIFMVAHHLVVDVVSWRVLVQDLSYMLETGSLPAEDAPSFRSWLALQAEDNKSITDAKALLPFDEPKPDLTYWGVKPDDLTYGKVVLESFTLDEDITKLALGDAQAIFRSEPADLLAAAIVHSFARTFTDRKTPALHTEGHGREAPTGSDADLSRTVGWFTAIAPLVIPVVGDVLDTVRRAKDVRRSIPANGRPYFAHKWLSKKASWSPMEIIFNFLGGGIQQESESSETTSLVRPVELADDIAKGTGDVGSETKRMALFEVSAVVSDNKLQFNFMFDGSLKKGAEVRKWISVCKATLEEMIQGLVRHAHAEPTLADYPLLLPGLTYDGLRTLTDVVLPRMGIEKEHVMSRVEEIYPCSPVQDGMLISQLRNPDAYIFHAIYRASATSRHRKVNAHQIAGAWQQVVDRHAALRTVFVETVRRDGVFDQIVLSHADSGAILLQTSNEQEAMRAISQVTLANQANHLPHQLALCTTDSGDVLMKLEMNHAAMDGGSISIILDELASAYAGLLEAGPGPLYSDYIRFIRSQPAGADTAYWMQHLKGVKPCYFPNLNTTPSSVPALRSLTLDFSRFDELRQVTARTHVTLANIMHAAWALVLRKYTKSDDVCFGYLTADRDAPVDGIARTVGVLINMLCCRIQLEASNKTLQDVFVTAQEERMQGLEFQRCSLARVQHELGMGSKPLYNTSISTQNSERSGEDVDGDSGGRGEGIKFEMEEGHDPSEVSYTSL